MTREDKAVTSKKEMQYYLAHGKEFGEMQAPLFADMWRLFSKVFDTFESRTCESCMYDDDCDIKWKIVENARKPQEPKWCSLWEAKDD